MKNLPRSPIFDTEKKMKSAVSSEKISQNVLAASSFLAFSIAISFLVFLATCFTQIDFDDRRQNHRSLAGRFQNIAGDQFPGLHSDLHVFI